MVELYSRKSHISRDLWNYIETGRQERQSLKGKHKGKLNRVVTPPDYLEISEKRDLIGITTCSGRCKSCHSGDYGEGQGGS